MTTNIDVVREHDDIMYPHLFLFLSIHAGCVATISTGVTWQAIVLGIVLYWLRMFAIGAGYHRYFSHRAYRADLRRNLRLSKMPTRDQFLTEAREMFTRTISLDDIIDRAYELLLESVGSLLVVQAQ